MFKYAIKSNEHSFDW